jgi:hypothetical protein
MSEGLFYLTLSIGSVLIGALIIYNELTKPDKW